MGLQDKMLRRRKNAESAEISKTNEEPLILFSFPDDETTNKNKTSLNNKKQSVSTKKSTSITFTAPEDEETVSFSLIIDKIKLLLKKFQRNKSKNTIHDSDAEEKSYADSDYDYALEEENIRKMKRDVQKSHKKRVYSKAGKVLMIIGAVYILFLIYGCIMTDFDYDDSGQLVPVVMTYQNIKDKKEFEELIKYYFRTRTLYEDILRYDYELAKDSSLSVSLGTKYNGILDDIDKANTKVKAFSPGIQYENLQNMLQNVIAEMSAYANAMSKALLQNNSDAAAEALQRRNNVYQKFMTISNNIAVIADGIPGIDKKDIEDIMSWSPDDYLQNLIQQ